MQKPDNQRMPKKRRPTIVVDEHVHPGVADVFKEVGFRTIFAARDRRYAGRDEHAYIGELYAANEVFVTADLEFSLWVLREHGTRHAGLVCLPFGDVEFRTGFAAVTAGWLWGSTDHSPFALRGKIIYWSQAGLQELDSRSRIRIAVPAHLVLEDSGQA